MVGMLDIKGKDQWRRVYSVDGIAPTLVTCQGGQQEVKIFDTKRLRVRKLTPKEYGILQAFPMDDWKQVVSDSQAYKQFGNAVTTTVFTAIAEEIAKGIRTVKIGGIGNATGKKYLLRFVHKDTQDGNIRVTIVGNNQAGFTIAFAKDSETVIDAEFKAQPMDKEGTLILYTEDIDKTE